MVAIVRHLRWPASARTTAPRWSGGKRARAADVTWIYSAPACASAPRWCGGRAGAADATRIYSAPACAAAPRWCSGRAGAADATWIYSAPACAAAPRWCGERAGTALGDAEEDDFVALAADGDRVGAADPGDWARAADIMPRSGNRAGSAMYGNNAGDRAHFFFSGTLFTLQKEWLVRTVLSEECALQQQLTPVTARAHGECCLLPSPCNTLPHLAW